MARRPPDDPAIVDTTAALASLYQAPFADFIATRAALVSQLKKSGHKEVAARIGGATKPSRAAWLTNQVYWRARKVYDAVLDAGTAARTAQQARLLGQGDADLATSIERRDAAVRAAVARAAALAGEDGGAASEAVLAQVRGSFEAIAAHGTDGRIAHGHLTSDVELPGLGALAGLVLPEVPAAPVRRFEVVARGTRSPSPAVADALAPDPRVVEAERRLAELIERETAAQERAAELERGVEAARQRLEQAEQAAAAAERELASAREAFAGGTRTQAAVRRDLEGVTRERAKAEAALQKLQQGREPDAPPPTSPTRRRAQR